MTELNVFVTVAIVVEPYQCELFTFVQLEELRTLSKPLDFFWEGGVDER